MSSDQPGLVDPAAAGATVGRRRSLKEGAPLARLELAAERFNESEAAHVVSGLVRTLGDPCASIGAAAGSSSEVRVTVAWELCWYQWGVDLASASRPVFEIGKGREVEELDGSARQWNATVGAGCRLALGTRPSRPRRAGEPVG
jgi:hypothetical protein